MSIAVKIKAHIPMLGGLVPIPARHARQLGDRFHENSDINQAADTHRPHPEEPAKGGRLEGSPCAKEALSISLGGVANG
jgi:hypothetical protein